MSQRASLKEAEAFTPPRLELTPTEMAVVEKRAEEIKQYGGCITPKPASLVQKERNWKPRVESYRT